MIQSGLLGEQELMAGAVAKSAIWRVLAKSYYATGMYRARHRGTVSIITYHRVVPTQQVREAYVQPGMYVTPETFELHVGFLREHFEILSMQELLENWKRNAIQKSRAYCVITFDDGWLDNYLYAYPILTKYGVPATIFLPTDFIGTSRWFWPEQLSYLFDRIISGSTNPDRRMDAYSVVSDYLGRDSCGWLETASEGRSTEDVFDRIIETCKDLQPEQIERLVRDLEAALHVELPSQRMLMNWDEVRDMSKSGMTFGSHSRSHRLLTKLSMCEVEEELTRSKEVLEQQYARQVPVFCYPNGNFNPTIQESVKASGYEAAVSCRKGYESILPEDLLALRRIGLHNDTSETIPLLTLSLSGLR